MVVFLERLFCGILELQNLIRKILYVCVRSLNDPDQKYHVYQVFRYFPNKRLETKFYD